MAVHYVTAAPRKRRFRENVLGSQDEYRLLSLCIIRRCEPITRAESEFARLKTCFLLRFKKNTDFVNLIESGYACIMNIWVFHEVKNPHKLQLVSCMQSSDQTISVSVFPALVLAQLFSWFYYAIKCKMGTKLGIGCQ